jgi:hypothetical protein
MSLEHSPARQRRAGRWPLLLSVQDAAYELGLSPRRIYQLIAAGNLDSVKINKARRVTSASVRRLAGEEGDNIGEQGDDAAE